MNTKEINSYDQLIENIKDKERAFLLLYKNGSEQSDCSVKNLSAVKEEDATVEVLMADVTSVRDIHTQYSITTVPTILEFEKGDFVNVLKGCHEPGFYKSFFENAIYKAKVANG